VKELKLCYGEIDKRAAVLGGGVFFSGGGGAGMLVAGGECGIGGSWVGGVDALGFCSAFLVWNAVALGRGGAG